MKMATREDISAPIDAVFAQLSDFDGFERAALRRGAEINRTDSLAQPGPGMAWRAGFPFRGRTRTANIELFDYVPPENMKARVHSSGLEITFVIDLVAMSRTRTRLNLSVDTRPRTLPARLMIQSMKLARQTVLKRFRKRVGEFAAEIEERANGAG